MFTTKLESDYLIITNKEKFSDIYYKNDLTEGDIIDALISLHIVLEVSLNTLFRHLSLMGIKEQISSLEIIENLDRIGFIEKTVLFIYNSKFNFGENVDRATECHKIIGTLRDFSGVRNQLLHGHSISTIHTSEEIVNSRLRNNMSKDHLDQQVEKFRRIIKGLRFYIDCLDSSLTQSGKDGFKKAYLDDDFISL